VASALLLTLSLPPHPLPFLAPVALAPLAYLLAGLRRGGAGARVAARAGVIHGAVHAALLLHWVPGAAAPLLGVPGAVAAAGVVWGGQAVLHGVALVLVHRAIHVGPFSPTFALPLAMGAAWILLGWVPSALPGVGFPWLGAEAALVGVPRLLALADLVGGAGVAGLLAFSGGGVGAILRSGPEVGRRAFTAGVVFLALGSAAGYGWYGDSRRGELEQGPSLSVLTVAIPAGPDLLRDADRRLDLFPRALGELTAMAGRWEPDLVLWPESPTGSVGPPAVEIEAATGAVAAFGVPVLFGAMAEVSAVSRGAAAARSNRFLLAPLGGGAEVVHEKRRLVPGVEWRLPGTPGRVQAGPPRGTFAVPGPTGVAAGVLICFESLFPAEARRLRRGGARVLFLGVNEGWLAGHAGGLADAARAQHRAAAVLLAVEARLPVVRSSVGGEAGGWDRFGHPLPVRDRWDGEGGGAVLVDVMPAPAGLGPWAARGGAAAPVAGAFLVLLLPFLLPARNVPARGRVSST
jgi:apolipoprotein N-acyltransferase